MASTVKPLPTIHTPPAALEAGARAMAVESYKHLPQLADTDVYTPDREYWLRAARAAFVAMVNAWPGIETEGVELHFSTARTAPVTTVKAYRLILPLPQETRDDE